MNVLFTFLFLKMLWRKVTKYEDREKLKPCVICAKQLVGSSVVELSPQTTNLIRRQTVGIFSANLLKLIIKFSKRNEKYYFTTQYKIYRI